VETLLYWSTGQRPGFPLVAVVEFLKVFVESAYNCVFSFVVVEFVKHNAALDYNVSMYGEPLEFLDGGTLLCYLAVNFDAHIVVPL
jgi:hypothetical protein